MEKQQKSEVGCQGQQLSKTTLGNCWPKTRNSPHTVASVSQGLIYSTPVVLTVLLLLGVYQQQSSLLPDLQTHPNSMEPQTAGQQPELIPKVRWKCKQALRTHLPTFGKTRNYVNLMLEQDHVPLDYGQGMISVALLNKEMKIHPTFLTWSV